MRRRWLPKAWHKACRCDLESGEQRGESLQLRLRRRWRCTQPRTQPVSPRWVERVYRHRDRPRWVVADSKRRLLTRWQPCRFAVVLLWALGIVNEARTHRSMEMTECLPEGMHAGRLGDWRGRSLWRHVSRSCEYGV